MTTPTTPDEPDAVPTAEHPTAEHPTAEHPAAGSPGAPEPTPPPPAGPPAPPHPAPPLAPYAYPPYAFAPKVREPWINPTKRRTFGLIAAAAAVVLLGGGIAIGAAAGDRHGRSDHMQQSRKFEQYPAMRAPRGGFQPGGVMPGNRRFNGPGQRPGPAVPTTSPTPVPSTSHS